MALAIPRQSIIDNIAQAGQLPAGGFTPEGMPGYDAINPESPVAARRRRHGAGEAADERGRRARRRPSTSTSTTPRATVRSRSRSRPPGRSSGSRSTIKQQEFAAVPGVPRAAAEQGRRRLPARLDRRLRRRDQLPRALDVRVGQQLDELLQRGLRRADRGGADDRGQRRPLRAVRAGGGHPLRRERRHADPADLLLHVRRARA